MNETAYLRHPSIRGDTILFVTDDDLWQVGATGGVARRLTAGLSEPSTPCQSPDGRSIAFVAYLQRSGYHRAVGLDEYNPRFAAKALLTRRYDCVLSQDVLEHVPDPQALLDLFDRLAAPGAIIAVGTPNASAIDLARAEHYRHTLHVPYHRHIFSRAGLIRSGQRRSWQLEQYYPTQYANTLVPFLNSPFYLFFMRTLDDTLDSLLEQPPRLGPCLARWPSALAWGLCGAYFAEETDVMAVFRARACR